MQSLDKACGGVFTIDVNIFMFGIVFPLLLVLIGLLLSSGRYENLFGAMLSGLGGLIGVLFALSVLADGSITMSSAATMVVLASSSLSVSSPWQFIELAVVIFPVVSFMVALYKVYRSIL